MFEDERPGKQPQSVDVGEFDGDLEDIIAADQKKPETSCFRKYIRGDSIPDRIGII